MPIQTETIDAVFDADGAKVEIKEFGAQTFTDLGAITGDIGAVLNWNKTSQLTNNAGKINQRVRDMTVDLTFTLINLNIVNINKLGSGVFNQVTTTSSANTSVPDQAIAAGWADGVLYNLVMLTSSSDSTPLVAAAKPTLASVTLDPDGTPEVLAEGTEYDLHPDPNSPSGWSISFEAAAFGTASPTTYDIVIAYTSVTPVATTTTHVGTSVGQLNPAVIQITHTDSNSRIRRLTLHAAYPESGFNFGFKGADTGGVESMDIQLTGELDSSLTDGRQLLSWVVQSGAQ